MTTKVKKPKKVKRSATYDWHEIANFIKKKYGKDVRDWSGWSSWLSSEKDKGPEPEYQDFWHHLIDRHEIHNGATITIYPEEEMTEHGLPAWKREIYQILLKEFGSEIEALTSW